MLPKLKKFFKLSSKKRLFILFFFFIFSGLFISLSFAFKSKDSKVSNDYSNGISLTINPTQEDGSQILEETYSKQLLQNLHKRLENAFPSSIVSSAYEVENVWNIDITNIAIDNLEQTNEIKNIIIEKNNLTLLPINATWAHNYLILLIIIIQYLIQQASLLVATL